MISEFWGRGALQLAGAYVLAALLPFAIAAALTPKLLTLSLFGISLFASMAAITIGFWSFRNLIEFPGIRASYYVLPVFSSTFVGAILVLFLLRLDYSRPLLVTSFLLSLLWFYVVYFMIQRGQRLRIAVVPFGRVDSLYALETLDWQPLDKPELPAGCTTLTADFDYDLPTEWVSFLAECALADVFVVHYKQLRQSLTGQVQMEHLSENAYGTLDPNSAYLVMKRLGDFIVASALLPFVLAMIVIFGIAIRLDSPGPALFRQTRIGYRGVPFKMWKLRTMRTEVPFAAQSTAPAGTVVMHDEARITAIGRWLRRTRLDEVPQIINVLRGEMSLIGPRPEAVALSQWYQAEIPFYRYRHVVRPGISGWAQVNQGHVDNIDEVLKKLSYDFYYISRFTFWIDMLIVVRTFKTIVTGYGSR